jgi:hypothetical protein
MQAAGNMSLLDETLPLYIVLYDPDMQFVREIEAHQVRSVEITTIRQSTDTQHPGRYAVPHETISLRAAPTQICW